MAKKLTLQDVLADIETNATENTRSFLNGVFPEASPAPQPTNPHLQRAYDQQNDLWQHPVVGSRQFLKRFVHRMIFFILHRQYDINTNIMNAVGQLDDEVQSLRGEIEMKLDAFQEKLTALANGTANTVERQIVSSFILALKPHHILYISPAFATQREDIANAILQIGAELVHAPLPDQLETIRLETLNEFARKTNLPNAPLPLNEMRFEFVIINRQAEKTSADLLPILLPMLAHDARIILEYQGIWQPENSFLQDCGDIFHDETKGLRLLRRV